MQELQMVMAGVAIAISIVFIIWSLFPKKGKACCGQGCGTPAPSAGRMPLTMTEPRVFKQGGPS
jgi:hypothetical protein